MQDWLKAGNKIEINTDDGEWSEEEILLIKEIRGINSITITTSYSDEELAETFDLDYYLEHDLIRPVKTEKEKWIDDAINVIEDYYAVHVNKHTHKLDVSEAKRQLGAIYDAGLAKYEYR